MKIKSPLAMMAAMTVAANAATFVTSYGPANNQAGPMFGQSITVNVGADTADGSISSTVYLQSLSLTRTGSTTGINNTDVVYIHVYDAFAVDGTASPTTIGNLLAVSSTTVDFATVGTNEVMTWNFDGTIGVNKAQQLYYVFAKDTVAATVGSSSNLSTQGLRLTTGNPYAGGQAYRANGTTSDWDAAFTLTTSDTLTVPEPSSVSLFGLGGLALLLRRRK